MHGICVDLKTCERGYEKDLKKISRAHLVPSKVGFDLVLIIRMYLFRIYLQFGFLDYYYLERFILTYQP